MFKVKKDTDSKVRTHKARLVARGFTQEHRVNCHETFLPVIRFSTFRMLLALAVEMDLQIYHWDVRAAFLQGNLKDEIYMEQPEGSLKRQKKIVCLLKKSIYGLKQAAKVWNDEINQVLKNLELKRSQDESCVYHMKFEEMLIVVALHVDDNYTIQ